MAFNNYRPQQSLAKVIFSQASVILSIGGVSASEHAEIYQPPRADTPQEQTCRPPKSRHPQEQTPHQKQTLPSRHTPKSKHPPKSRHPARADNPPEQTPPKSRHPQVDTPPKNRHPRNSRHPKEQTPLPHTVKEWLVRILLECIVSLSSLQSSTQTQFTMKFCSFTP